jgi:integrase
MIWSEVDFDNAIWTIPSSRMKAKAQHRVPLSPAALTILRKQRDLDSEFVFPSVRSQKQLTDMTITMLLRRLEAPSDTEARLATAHGFRSSFRDWCSENSYPRDLAERALAHTVQNKVEAAYHRTDLLEQRRPMMHKWAEFVSGVQPKSMADLLVSRNTVKGL